MNRRLLISIASAAILGGTAFIGLAVANINSAESGDLDKDVVNEEKSPEVVKEKEEDKDLFEKPKVEDHRFSVSQSDFYNSLHKKEEDNTAADIERLIKEGESLNINDLITGEPSDGEDPILSSDKRPLNEYREKLTDDYKRAWLKIQPTRAKWFLEKKNKHVGQTQGKAAINLIRDYTFHFTNPCLGGTFWILDYELPEDGGYPTKFFFGTNAHVAAGIEFTTNPYNQILPKLGSNSDHCQSPIVGISRELDLYADEDILFNRQKWPDHSKGSHWPSRSGKKPNDVETWDEDKHGKPLYYYFETTDAKLVYIAANFEGKGDDSRWGEKKYNSSDYLVDFAVVEIDFKNPLVAKRMTMEFHDKYNFETGSKRNEAIDFFAKPLSERKTNKQLYEDVDIYVAGYPSNGVNGRSVGSYDAHKEEAARLTYSFTGRMFKDKNNPYDDLIGHGNISYSGAALSAYGGLKYARGLEFILDREYLKGGSSGSLTTDGEKKALGVKSRGGGGHAYIDAFRSEEVKVNGKTIIPAYDLIEGTKSGVSNSYKDSIVNHLLKGNPKKQTHLSKFRRWTEGS